jgi:hypothetical protein
MKRNHGILGAAALSLAAVFLFAGCMSKPKTSGDGFVYKTSPLGDNTITDYQGTATDVVIPGEIDGKEIVKIGSASYSRKEKTVSGAFDGKGLTSVVIPDNITVIGREAFANNQLTDVKIPEKMGGIYASAFANNRLTNVTIPVGGEISFYGNGEKVIGVLLGLYDGQPGPVTTADVFAGNPIESITFAGEAYLFGITALGKLGPYYYANNKKPGTYSLVDGQWTFEGEALTELPAVIGHVHMSGAGGFTIGAVDGGGVSKYSLGNRTIVTLFIPAGEHSLTVIPNGGQPYEFKGTLKAGAYYNIVAETVKDSSGEWVSTGNYKLEEDQEKPYDFKLEP